MYAPLAPSLQIFSLPVAKIDADDSGKVDGREAAKLLGKSGLTREQLSAVWIMADADEDGELSPSEWAVAMHLAR